MFPFAVVPNIDAQYCPVNRRVPSVRGSALLFFPVYLDGRVNPWMMHNAEDVVGSKLVAQAWFTREAASLQA